MFISVAVPVPALDLLTYEIPTGDAMPPVGARVVVPLGNRSVTGVVVATGVDAKAAKGRQTKAVKKVLDTEPFVPADVVALARWTAEYYAAGAGEAITAVLPPMTRDERADAHKVRQVATITAAGLDGLDSGTPKQREALQMLAGSPDGIAVATLGTRGIGRDTLARLMKSGAILLRQEKIDRDPFETATVRAVPDAARTLTAEQQEAVARLTELAAAATFRVALLHGVTGSGKTEVYLRLAAFVRDGGRRVLMLVPEIALTPAVAGALRAVFGERVAIQHSGLSNGERHDQWQRIRRGAVDVVVGTRSAIFAPLSGVGLIIVDEEHDGSYKQDESPRYNGRDVAIVRGQQAGALVVLGSATPSMESYQNAMSGRYERVVLAHRVHERPMANVRVVDMRQEYAAEGPEVILSRQLRDAMAARIERGEQVVVLLNRRGFATAVFCRQCAGTVDCPNCSVSLVIHGDGPSRRARCHYCNYQSRVPAACPTCAAPYMEQTGFGTERVEVEVRRVCPSARVARVDRDAVRRKGALAETLARFRDGALDVLVGTQMVAKGHDFPKVTLVGVISADVGLGMADFRASERTFQILTQVAGRAGRGDRVGEAIVQTIYPDHYAIQLACRQDYPAFFAKELHFRTAMRYPPQVALINGVVRGATYTRTLEDAVAIVQQLREATSGMRDVRVLGPAPAPIAKLRGEFRVQFLVKGTNRKRMRQALLDVLAQRPDVQRRTTVDIDPVSVM